MSKSKFLIPSILAAGFIPATSAVAAENPNHISTDKSLIDDIVEHAQSITDFNEFNLAGHRSHGSHQSHASHSSHRSYYAPEPPNPDPTYRPSDSSYEAAALSGRNEASTPRSSVLPTSITTVRKPKILKGNSAKFAEIVSRTQVALQMKGFEPGEINGELHSRTIAALYKFQRDSGLAPTGRLENETLNHLGVVAN